MKRLVFFDPDSGDKKTGLSHKLNRIGVTPCSWTCIYSSDFHSVLGDFQKVFCASHKSERTRILYFLRTNSYFQDFTKFKDNSRTKGTFLKFQEFSRTKVKFKNFSRSVRALFVHFEVEFQKFRILEILNFHPCVESTMILYSSL